MSSNRGPWKGEEVTDKTGGQAEAAAERTAGRGPVTGAAAVNGDRPKDRGRPDQVAARQRTAHKADTAETDRIQEEKRQAAVEQHQEDRAAGTGTAPKNI